MSAVLAPSRPMIPVTPGDIIPGDGEATRFLDLIAPDAAISFQTFSDKKSKGSGLVRVRHGSIGSFINELRDLNARGAGVFFMVNAGDMKGRGTKNVRRVRALFVDLDGAPLEPVLQCGVQPHAIVESSPGRWHAYWLVSDCRLDDFGPLQRALMAKFDGDRVVHDLPRVMRIPGFLHCKSEQQNFRSRIVTLRPDLPSYLVATITARLGFDGQAHRRAPTEETEETEAMASVGVAAAPSVGVAAAPSVGVAAAPSVGVAGSSDLLSANLPAPACPAGEGEREVCLYELARWVKGKLPSATREQRAAIFCRWWSRFVDVIGTKDFDVSMAAFERAWGNVRIPWGSIIEPIVQCALKAPLHPAAEGISVRAGTLLAKATALCALLQRHHDGIGEREFFVSCSTLGQCLGIDRSDAAGILRDLRRDGVLLLVTQGAGRKASRYVFLQPDAEWNRIALGAQSRPAPAPTPTPIGDNVVRFPKRPNGTVANPTPHPELANSPAIGTAAAARPPQQVPMRIRPFVIPSGDTAPARSAVDRPESGARCPGTSWCWR